MKKISLIILSFIAGFSSFSQDAANKNVQAGLTASAGLNFQTMRTSFLTSKLGSDLTVGMNINFNYSETLGLCTGVEFDFETLKYAASSDRVFYYYNNSNNQITLYKDRDLTLSTTKLYELKDRTQKVVYLTIPTMFIFRTKFFGYFRYFGKFGLRNSFLLKNVSNDKGWNRSSTNDAPNTDAPLESNNGMSVKRENLSRDMVFFKSAVGICGGADWNFSGSTSLVAEIGYYYGLVPLYWNKDNKTSLFTAGGNNNGGGNDTPFSNRANQGQLMLKLSILF